jgi:preprotein translocase subunit SecG
MVGFLTAIHVLVALVLILVVLLQSARGTDLAGAFGGMGSQTAFGPRGTTTFLSKTTAALAAVFMVTSLTLAILSNRSRGRGSSILNGEKSTATQSQKPAPVAVPVTPQPQVTVIPPSNNPAAAGTAAPINPQSAPVVQGKPNEITPAPPPISNGAKPPGNSQAPASPANSPNK